MAVEGTSQQFDPQTVQALAKAAEIDVDDESRSVIASILTKQIGHLRTFPLFDLTEGDPEHTYDPRW